MKLLRIGINTSPLAQVQSIRIKNAFEQYVPELPIQFVTVEEDTLTHALLTDEIDCFAGDCRTQEPKNLSDITVYAVMPRANPRDVAVFNDDILEKLKNNERITIGISSARHNFNVIPFLKDVLPYLPVDIVTQNLGKDVLENATRLDKDCDGIIISIADVNDAAQDQKIKKLLENCRFMILPLSECPTVPGQGAIALYGRSDDSDLKNILAPLHDISTEHHVEREYNAVRQEGLNTGATSINTNHFPDYIMFVKNEHVKSVTWPDMPRDLHGQAWDGADKRSIGSQTVFLPVAKEAIRSSAVFVTHSRAAIPSIIPDLENKILWTSGIQSWMRLARQGLWVQGCTEELGVTVLNDTISQVPCLNLPAMDTWQILTHDGTRNEWPPEQVIATYTVDGSFDPSAANELTKAVHIFWSSASQYELYKDYAAKNCYHHCRAGKTADLLKSYHLSPLTVYPNLETWRQCLNHTL